MTAQGNAETKNRLGSAEGKLRPDSLVGSFCHAFGGAHHSFQGCVVAEPSPGVYLIEFFSWIGGDSTYQQLVRLDDMIGWRFYDSAEWMNAAYEGTVQRLWEQQAGTDA